MFAEVIVDIATSEVDKIFDYDCGGFPVTRGVRVLVPFGRMEIEGFVVNVKDSTECPAEKIKSIKSVIDPYPVITEEMFKLMEYMKENMHLLTVHCLRLFIPAAMRGGRVKELKRLYVRLNGEYLNADPASFIKQSSTAQLELFGFLKEHPEGAYLSDITKDYSQAAVNNFKSRGIVTVEEETKLRVPSKNVIQEDEKKLQLTDAQKKVFGEISAAGCETILIHGVTGSGKTEVYKSCIEKVLNEGKTAIMLVPEISLTPQFLKQFRDRFGSDVALLHSGLGNGERYDEWRKCISGEARVALGPRSAVFAPLKNLGIIIIDEEHDSSYISDSTPRYNTYDVAKFRSVYNGCNLVLGSATPSVESFFRALSGDYKLLSLPERVNKKPLPGMEVVDMRKEWTSGNTSIFSRALKADLDECISSGNQAILFLNRRGYASFVRCRMCGYIAKCDDCDVSLVYHREENLLKCHYCGKCYTTISMCPQCKSLLLKEGYVGTEKVADMLGKMYPGTGIGRMDNDTVQKKDGHAEILSDFGSGKTKILVGTQMVAKGHDFPSVTLVGILDADMSLHVNDYRAVERTYQLATQVAGRAGRADKAGKVILQTYSPDHYIYEYIKNNDYRGFYEKEINLRDVSKFPPYSTIVRVLVCGDDDKTCGSVLKDIYGKTENISRAHPGSFHFFQYMRSPLKKLKGLNRMQILIRLNGGKEENAGIINEIFDATESSKVKDVTAYAEINPVSLA